MEVWIQRHDFVTDALEDKTREQCLSLLDSFDWNSELAKYEDALVLRAAHAYQTANPLTDRRP